MAQLSDEIFPDGVTNVVTGGGSTTGTTLIEHEDARKLSFTAVARRKPTRLRVWMKPTTGYDVPVEAIEAVADKLVG